MDTSMTGGRSMSSAIAIPWGSAANPNPPPSSRKEPVMVLTGTSGTTRGSSETRPDTGGPRSRVNAERLGLDWMPRTWGMVGSYASYQAMSSWTSIRSPSATPSRSAWPAAYLFAVAVTAFPSASLITSVPAVSAAPAMTLTIGPIWTPRSFAVTAPLATSEPRAPHISSPAPQRARSALVVLTNRHGLADRSAVVCRGIHWVLLAGIGGLRSDRGGAGGGGGVLEAGENPGGVLPCLGRFGLGPLRHGQDRIGHRLVAGGPKRLDRDPAGHEDRVRLGLPARAPAPPAAGPLGA